MRKQMKSTVYLFVLLAISIVGLAAPRAAADSSAILDINFNVEETCTLTFVGSNSISNTFNPGANSQIGTSTLKAVCNDGNGMAIYAVGYTGNVYGATSLISGNNYILTNDSASPTYSQWNMTVANASTQGNYTAVIPDGTNSTEDFTHAHAIPNEYEKIASRSSLTDQTVGMNINTSVSAYVAPTQASGTYEGKIKFTLIHPNSTKPAIDGKNTVVVTFDGNGLLFPDGSSTNVVTYAPGCDIEQNYGDVYVGTEYEEVMTSNISSGGTASGPYTSSEDISETFTFANADGVKVEARFRLSIETYYVNINNNDGAICDLGDGMAEGSSRDHSGTEICYMQGDTVTVTIQTWDSPTTGYDYGLYVKLSPTYDTEHANTSKEQKLFHMAQCSPMAISGQYMEPIGSTGKWELYERGSGIFVHGQGVDGTVNDSLNMYTDTAITLVAYNPYTISYDGNGASAGTMNNYVSESTNYQNAEVKLLAPNFYKTGYGFAGWSEDPQATPGGSSTIYGPNEIADVSAFTYDNHRKAKLYAIWTQSVGSLQSWNGCSSLSEGDVIALSDARDNNTYAVAKLADSKCWMTENLRLEADDSLDSTKAQGYASGFTGLADPEDQTFTGGTTANSRYSTSNVTGDNIAKRIPRYNNNFININGTSPSGASLEAKPYAISGSQAPGQWYSYGNLYNWPAAVASIENITTNTDYTSTSICPSGWHLPTKADSNALIVANGGTASQSSNSSTVRDGYLSYPANFILAGNWNGSQQQWGQDAGSYWLAASYNQNTAFSLNLWVGFGMDPSSFQSAISPLYTYNSKTYGLPVRCIKN